MKTKIIDKLPKKKGATHHVICLTRVTPEEDALFEKAIEAAKKKNPDANISKTSILRSRILDFIKENLNQKTG